MTRWVGILTVAAVIMGIGGIGVATAQEPGQGAGRLEISAFPGGGLLFTEGSDGEEPDFGNYALGGSLTYNVNRYVGVEGEIGGGLGVEQRLNFADGASIGDTTPPDMLAYNGNLVVYPFRSDRSFVPYATGGLGGLTLFSEEDLGVNDNETFFAGNIGGGAKWFFGRWGVRGDYRFIAIDSKDDAPSFFGQRETRHGHRFYGGIVLNLAR